MKFAFPQSGRSKQNTAMQPEASRGGERLHWGDYSGLWAVKPCLDTQRRTEGKEAPSYPVPAPWGPLSGMLDKCYAGIVLGAGDTVVKDRTKPLFSSPFLYVVPSLQVVGPFPGSPSDDFLRKFTPVSSPLPVGCT